MLAVFLAGCAATPDPNGNKAPYFELQDVKGEVWNLDDLKGEVVILYFWSASCSPCVAKLPDLSKLQTEIDDDVALLLINLSDSVQRINQVADSNLNILVNGSNVFSRYGIRYTPTFVFIDKDGYIQETRIGAMSNNEIQAKISELR